MIEESRHQRYINAMLAFRRSDYYDIGRNLLDFNIEIGANSAGLFQRNM